MSAEKNNGMNILLVAVIILAAAGRLGAGVLVAPKYEGKEEPTSTVVWPRVYGEVWIGPAVRSNLGTRAVVGDGSRERPFVGDFDWMRQNLTNNVRVHLRVGNYWTAADGSGPLRTGQRWSGAGMGLTVIRRDPESALERSQAIFVSQESGIMVEEMTLDPRGNEVERWKRSGLELVGSYNTVREIEVVHPSGCARTGQECFAIFVGGPGTVGNRVMGCRVRSVRGDYVTAVTVNGQAVTSFCQVEFLAGVAGAFAGYQASYGQDALFFGNRSIGGGYGYYTDTGSDTNVVVMGNFFTGCVSGIVWEKQMGTAVNGIRVAENQVTLTGTNGVGVMVRMQDPSGVRTNVVIEGNLVRRAPPADAQ